MKTRLAAALAGALVALSLSACGAPAPAAPTPAPYSPPADDHSKPLAAYATETASPSPSAPAKPAAPAFAGWLATNYPGVSWAPLVKTASERSGVLWIETSIYPDGDAPALAQPLCTAGRAYALETGDPYNGEVSVRASSGLRLAEC